MERNVWLNKIEMIASLLVSGEENWAVSITYGIFVSNRLSLDSEEEAVYSVSGPWYKVISQGEMNKVRDEKDTVMDKAPVLIDLIIGKGCWACHKSITHLREDHQPALKIWLH
ncbi:caspase recruitment domain-containing protein 18 [Myotis myotis]|nr:caspase recruitment domain-containing protein 18 [Myotis myotis]